MEQKDGRGEAVEVGERGGICAEGRPSPPRRALCAGRPSRGRKIKPAAPRALRAAPTIWPSRRRLSPPRHTLSASRRPSRPAGGASASKEVCGEVIARQEDQARSATRPPRRALSAPRRPSGPAGDAYAPRRCADRSSRGRKTEPTAPRALRVAPTILPCGGRRCAEGGARGGHRAAGRPSPQRYSLSELRRPSGPVGDAFAQKKVRVYPCPPPLLPCLPDHPKTASEEFQLWAAGASARPPRTFPSSAGGALAKAF